MAQLIEAHFLNEKSSRSVHASSRKRRYLQSACVVALWFTFSGDLSLRKRGCIGLQREYTLILAFIKHIYEAMHYYYFEIRIPH